MEFHVRMMDRALSDLEDIYHRIHAADSDAAFRWFNGLNSAIFSLEKNPSRGTVTLESKQHWQLVYGKKPHIYRIIYTIEIENSAVNIIHLRHGAMSEFTAADLQ
jgi:toxin ParE1/3/4